MTYEYDEDYETVKIDTNTLVCILEEMKLLDRLDVVWPAIKDTCGVHSEFYRRLIEKGIISIEDVPPYYQTREVCLEAIARHRKEKKADEELVVKKSFTTKTGTHPIMIIPPLLPSRTYSLMPENMFAADTKTWASPNGQVWTMASSADVVLPHGFYRGHVLAYIDLPQAEVNMEACVWIKNDAELQHVIGKGRYSFDPAEAHINEETIMRHIIENDDEQDDDA